MISFFKTLSKPFRLPTRFLSFATPKEAAAERPLLRHNQPQRRIHQNPNPNPPKLPDHDVSAKRLDYHNRIWNLIRENHLEEASLLTRYSIYANCKPTIFTANSVMAALLRQGKYPDLLQLHRSVTQAGVIPNVGNGKVQRAVELKDEMMGKGLGADPIVYNFVISRLMKVGEFHKASLMYNELEDKVGRFVSLGVLHGNLINSHFFRGREKEAMEIYKDAMGEASRITMGSMTYNYKLHALVKNGKFEEGVKLYDGGT